MEDSDAGKREAEEPIDVERDELLLRAGYALAGKFPMPATYGAIYSGGGVHIGPSKGRTKHRIPTSPEVKFSFDHALAANNVCEVFHALQEVLGGGEIAFNLDHKETWSDKPHQTCSSSKCKRE